jgi:hypothetical protein
MKRVFLRSFIALYLIGLKIHKKIVKWSFGSLEFTLIISEGFWLSVLSKKTIAALDEHHYNLSEKYYTDTYNRMGFFEWESDMTDRYFEHCKTLMVLGSGGGREMYVLLQRGFEVDGFDCNTRLLDFSRQFLQRSGLTSTPGYAQPDHCPDNGKIYDGIILGWGAYTHVLGKNQRINLLKEINSHLQAGSPLLLSFWFAYENIDIRCQKLVKVNRFFCKIFRNQPIEKGDLLTEFSGHVFTFQEVRYELEQAGFSVVYEASHPYGHMVAHKKQTVGHDLIQ